MFGTSLASLALPLILAQLGFAGVGAVPTAHYGLEHVKRAEPHEVEQMFKRAPMDPNTPDFASHYPPAFESPSGTQIPEAWLRKLASVRLPGCPQASGSGNPSYNGANGDDPSICSFTYGCSSNEDLKDTPPGTLAISFDDGPAGGTDALWQYLGEQNARNVGTHFMIGSYIVNNPTTFAKIASEGGHIAVHTWSHKYTTTLSNEQIVGELGWTMQLMADLNGGRIPRFWRPPYGDVDNRVRAIAKGVFGLDTVTWNEDTGDWQIGYNGGYTVDSVTGNYMGWLRGDKARGLNVLQHELTNDDVAVFRNALPRAREMGWKVGNVADSYGLPWYQNAAGPNTTVASMAVGDAAPAIPSSVAPSSTSASASASASDASASPTSAASPAPSDASASPSPAASSAGVSQDNQSRPSPSSSATSAGFVTGPRSILAVAVAFVAVLVM